MDHAVEASAQRVRDHLRRPLAGSRDLLMETAGNTVNETVPSDRRLDLGVVARDGMALPPVDELGTFVVAAL